MDFFLLITDLLMNEWMDGFLLLITGSWMDGWISFIDY